jgi:outer membrane protein assembly factor BamD
MGVDQEAEMKKLALVALGILTLVGCSSRHKHDMGSQLYGRSDRAAWDEGEKLVAKKRYADARVQFKRLVDGFPNSELLPQARLALADTYFEQGGSANYILAISEYRQFLTLYPSATQSDFAQFRIAESYFKDKHGIERDQTPTHQALDEYQRLVDLHPQSKYVEEAKARIAECRQSLARADFLVGYFYQHTRQAYRSASRRYESLLVDYPDYTHTDEVLYRLSECLLLSSRGAEAAPHLQRLIASYPDSPFVADAKELQKKADAAPRPAASPSAAPTTAPIAPGEAKKGTSALK